MNRTSRWVFLVPPLVSIGKQVVFGGWGSKEEKDEGELMNFVETQDSLGLNEEDGFLVALMDIEGDMKSVYIFFF